MFQHYFTQEKCSYKSYYYVKIMPLWTGEQIKLFTIKLSKHWHWSMASYKSSKGFLAQIITIIKISVIHIRNINFILKN